MAVAGAAKQAAASAVTATGDAVQAAGGKIKEAAPAAGKEGFEPANEAAAPEAAAAQ